MNRYSPPYGALPTQPNPIAVRARVVWELDGECWQSGIAFQWNQQHVYVRLTDPEVEDLCVWLAPKDVRRAEAVDNGNARPA
jgi:hypothetical protein